MSFLNNYTPAQLAQLKLKIETNVNKELAIIEAKRLAAIKAQQQALVTKLMQQTGDSRQVVLQTLISMAVQHKQPALQKTLQSMLS